MVGEEIDFDVAQGGVKGRSKSFGHPLILACVDSVRQRTPRYGRLDFTYPEYGGIGEVNPQLGPAGRLANRA